MTPIAHPLTFFYISYSLFYILLYYIDKMLQIISDDYRVCNVSEMKCLTEHKGK